MRNLVVASDGGEGADRCVRLADEMALAAGGAVVLVSVLPGSRVGRGLEPREAGRRRREEEDRAKEVLLRQVTRTVPGAPIDIIALFGDVASDTILIATNLGADAVLIPSTDPAVADLVASSPIPVLVVPAP